MSNTNVQPESNKALDIGVVTLAVLIVAAGIFAFTFLTDQQLGIRIGALVGGLVIGCGVAAFSPSANASSVFAVSPMTNCAALSGRPAVKR